MFELVYENVGIQYVSHIVMGAPYLRREEEKRKGSE